MAISPVEIVCDQKDDLLREVGDSCHLGRVVSLLVALMCVVS